MKKVFALILAVLMIFTLFACDRGEKPPEPGHDQREKLDFSGRELTLGAWGGTFADACKEAYIKPFEELTGAKINVEEFGADIAGKVISQVEQNLEGFDIICGLGAVALEGQLVEKIAYYEKLTDAKVRRQVI